MIPGGPVTLNLTGKHHLKGTLVGLVTLYPTGKRHLKGTPVGLVTLNPTGKCHLKGTPVGPVTLNSPGKRHLKGAPVELVTLNPTSKRHLKGTPVGPVTLNPTGKCHLKGTPVGPVTLNPTGKCYLKGDPEWRYKLARKQRKCASTCMSIFRLCVPVLLICMQQKCMLFFCFCFLLAIWVPQSTQPCWCALYQRRVKKWWTCDINVHGSPTRHIYDVTDLVKMAAPRVRFL